MKCMRYTMLAGMWFIAAFGNQTPSQPAIQHRAEKSSSTNPANLLGSIQKELRDSKYRQEILPNNFSYLLQLLEHGVKTNQPHDYAQNVFRLFGKLLKGSEYVNSYVFSTLMQQLPSLLKHHFAVPKIDSALTHLALHDMDVLERLQHSVTSVVYKKFTNEFTQCKENPELFLDDLTQKILSVTNHEISAKDLRQTVLGFVEVGLSKLIWNPNDHEKSWESVKTLAHNLATLMEHNVIDNVDDLDDLFWTLTHRFCYYLDLNGADMPLSFHAKVKNDIATQQLVLFDLEEQESFLQPKSECVLNTLLTQEAKRRAEDYNSLTKHVV